MSDSIYIGIDSGATTSKIAAVWEDSSPVSMDLLQRPTNSENGRGGVIQAWTEAIVEFLEANSLAWDAVRGVGVAVPGPMRSYGVLDFSPNLPKSFRGWDIGADLSAALRELMGHEVPLSLGNDGNFGGVAEARLIRENGGSSVVMLAPGSGLGGAYVNRNGLPLDGETLAGMEVGHIPAPLQVLDAPAYPCGCGRSWGCFEVYTSLAGLPYLLKDALPRYPGHPLCRPDDPTKEDAMALRGLAQEGDALATELFDFQARAMGLLVANLSMAVDPGTFVIGGGLMDPDATTAGFRTRYLDILRDTAHEYVWDTQCERIKIVPARLGELSQGIGAALVALYASERQEPALQPA
jgi:glucokinase